MRIECVSRCKDKEWKEIKGQDIGGFRIHTHRNQQTTGQRQENSDETNKLLI